MDSTVHALQDLYVKKGGQLTDTYEGIADGIPVADYVTIPDLIEAVSMLGGGGGGGGEVFYVDFSVADTTASTLVWESNKTYTEIMTAYNSGYNVLGRVVNPSQTTIYKLSAMYDFDETDKFIEFTNFGSIVDTNIVMSYFQVRYDNSVNLQEVNVAFTE